MFRVSYLAALLLGCLSIATAQSVDADLERMQGNWRVLAAFDDAIEKQSDTKFRGSHVAIVKNQLVWKAADGKPLFAAAIQIRPADKKGIANEIDLTTEKSEGKEGRVLPGRYVLEKNHLRLSVRIKDSAKAPDPRVNQVTTRPQFLTFILERAESDKPGAPNASQKKDAERILGKWDVIAYFDDGDDYTNRGRAVVITNDRIEWKGDFKTKQVSVGANYKLHPEKSPPWFDMLGTKGGNPLPPEDGFLPSIYTFLDDDTLFISWPESGWKKDTKPEDRKRPTRILSDGDVNLWILRRQP